MDEQVRRARRLESRVEVVLPLLRIAACAEDRRTIDEQRKRRAKDDLADAARALPLCGVPGRRARVRIAIGAQPAAEPYGRVKRCVVNVARHLRAAACIAAERDEVPREGGNRVPERAAEERPRQAFRVVNFLDPDRHRDVQSLRGAPATASLRAIGASQSRQRWASRTSPSSRFVPVTTSGFSRVSNMRTPSGSSTCARTKYLPGSSGSAGNSSSKAKRSVARGRGTTPS